MPTNTPSIPSGTPRAGSFPTSTRFEWNEGETLDSVLDRAMRAEADVIYIDPLRDAETARIILKRQPDACFYCGVPRFGRDQRHRAVRQARRKQSGGRRTAGRRQPAARPPAVQQVQAGLPPQSQDARQDRPSAGNEKSLPGAHAAGTAARYGRKGYPPNPARPAEGPAIWADRRCLSWRK